MQSGVEGGNAEGTAHLPFHRAYGTRATSVPRLVYGTPACRIRRGGVLHQRNVRPPVSLQAMPAPPFAVQPSHPPTATRAVHRQRTTGDEHTVRRPRRPSVVRARPPTRNHERNIAPPQARWIGRALTSASGATCASRLACFRVALFAFTRVRHVQQATDEVCCAPL